MPVRNSPYFNSPAMAQAANNLSALFAPPSGADAAGWATAKAKKEEAARLAQLFDLAQAAELDQDRFDRMGMAADLWNPNQGFQLTERGQNMESADRRYGTDVDARTTLQTNRLDNQRSALTDFYQPLAQGEVRPEVPGDLAEFIFGPDVGPIAPTAGMPKPPSRTEVEGSILQGMTPEEQQAIVFGNTAVEQVVTDDGPRITTRLDSLGQEPVIADRSPGTVRMYRTKDGQIGRTVDGMTDMVTNMPIPADAVIGTISDTSESFGTSELSKARETILGRRAGVTSMINQVATIDEQLANADADQAVGIVGSAARVFNDLATQTGAALRAAGVDAPEGLRDASQYQDTFRALGVQNAELQSGLLDLAYATAQSREPGKLTEPDIDRALRTIGANLQDPLAMRQVLRGAVKRATTDYRATESTLMDAYGDNLNLQPAQFPEIPPIDGAGQPPRSDGPHPAVEDNGEGWVVMPNGVRIKEESR